MSLAERKKALEERAGGGVTRPGVERDQMQDWIAQARQAQNERIAEYRESLKATKRPTARFGGESLSAPPIGPRQPATPQTRAEQLQVAMEERNRSAGAPIRDFFRKELGNIGKFFFGESEEMFSGQTLREPLAEEGFVESIKKDIGTRGLLRFLFQNTLKEDTERANELAFDLRNQGYSRSEAMNLATAYYQNKDNPDIPENVSLVAQSKDQTTKAWTLVEMIDLFPVFRAATRGANKTFVRETLVRSMAAENAVESRKILAEAFPQLRGTQQLTELSQLTRIVGDPVKGEQFLREVMETSFSPAQTTTPAQRIFFQNGTPIVRGGTRTVETATRRGRVVPNQTADALKLRDEIRTVLAGERESSRLSNLDILADEIEAGALPFRTTADDAVELFVDADIPVGRLRPGDRVASAKEVLESVSDSGKARVEKILPKDLVRLDDGTFVYAPKSAISKGVGGTLRAIRASQRARVQAIEKSQEISRMNRQMEAQRMREEAAARAAERAKQQAKEVAKARQTIESSRGLVDKRVAEIRADASKRVAEIRETTKAASKELNAARREVDKLVKQVGKKQRDLAKVRDRFRGRINAVTNRTRMTGKEKDALRKSLRKERDKLIKTINKKYDRLSKDVAKARKRLSKAEGKMRELPNRDVAIQAVKAEAKQSIADVKEMTAKQLAEARRVIDEGGEVGAEVAKELRKPTAVRIGDGVAERVQESGVYTTEFSGSLTDAKTKVMKPIDSDGKEVVSAVSKRILEQANEWLVRAGGDATLVPAQYRIATNKTQVENAVRQVYENPELAYQRYMETPPGQLEDTSNAALGLALTQHQFVKGNVSRLRAVVQKFSASGEGTRLAQELQARVMWNSSEKADILSRIFNKVEMKLQDRVGGAKAVDTEVDKLIKELGDEWENLATASKDDVVELINRNICS